MSRKHPERHAVNEKLAAIAKQAATNLEALINEAGDDILQAWDDCAEEAQVQEKSPKLRLGYSIGLDLDKNAASYDLSFVVKRTRTVNETIPDPNQPPLPFPVKTEDYKFTEEETTESN